MATVNRADLINKTYKVLKKHYTPFAPNPQRSLLEQLLYACCLENSLPEAADAVMQRVQNDYYDLNEIRVTTAREMAEALKPLNDADDAALRLKGVLQGVFETLYSFDMEPMRKQNLGQAVKTIEKYEGATPYVVSYATQTALGGHSIPVNAGAMQALVIIGVLTEAEAAKGRVPGLERTIPKAKGIEFGSLLHQLGVALAQSPFSPAVRNILIEVSPDAKQRLPKRASKPKKEKPKPAKKSKTAAKTTKKKAAAKPTKSKAAAKPATKKKAAKSSSTKKKTAKKPATKKTATKKTTAKKATAKKKTAKKAAAKKSTGKTKKKSSAAKSTSKGITKRKPK